MRSIPLFTVFGAGSLTTPVVRRFLAHSALAIAFASFCGCTRVTPSVGPIQFVDSAGTPVPAVSSLAVNGVAYFDETVSNDPDFLGVTWTVSCGSQPAGGEASSGVVTTACGTFNPVQTASGPVPTYPTTEIIVTEYSAPTAVPNGNTVTITAHATSLPSATSSVNLTIMP